jgi:hypothetical protein
MYYIYFWFNTSTLEIFYIGLGTGKRRFEVKKRNKLFLQYYQENSCAVRIYKASLQYNEARELEMDCIAELKPSCNISRGGELTNGEKISKALKGRKLSESHRKKLKYAAESQKRMMINSKKVVVLDKGKNIIKSFDAKYQIGIWLHEELGYGKNPRSAQRKADKCFKSGELFDGSYYFKRESI